MIGEINQKVGDLLGEQLRDGMPILEINAELNELSQEANNNIKTNEDKKDNTVNIVDDKKKLN